MGRNDDYAPIGNTCPMIDEVKGFLELIDWDMDDEDEVELSKQCKKVCDTLEKIRDANLALRNWGNEECKKAIEFEKDLDYSNDKITDLKSEIKDLQSQCTELENQLEEFTNQ